MMAVKFCLETDNRNMLVGLALLDILPFASKDAASVDLISCNNAILLVSADTFRRCVTYAATYRGCTT